MFGTTQRNRTRERLLISVLLSACLLSSVGCYITEINPDGSGELQRVILTPPGATPHTFCPPAGRGYTLTITNGVCIAKASFKNLSELRELLEAAESPKVRINQLEKTGGRLIIDISVEATKWIPPYTPGERYVWVLKMPGQVTNHNAHDVDDQDPNRLTWTSSPENAVFRIHVESQV